ncbi:hypothetical protein M9458_043373 [Cirrhinus mrigala]|uniref:Transmembrane protein n=1 Tax=Cirrhinus mrigala TaxID=683832 RepID=A0ABD0NH37_CIRMR
MAATSEPVHHMESTPESRSVMGTTPEPCSIMGAISEPPAVMKAASVFPAIMNMASKAVKVIPGPNTDVIARSWHLNRRGAVVSAHSSPVATAPSSPAVFRQSAALPVIAVAILCVWAAHCSPTHESFSEPTPAHKSAPEPFPAYESAPKTTSVNGFAPEPTLAPEFPVCSDTTTEVILELPVYPDTTTEVVYELPANLEHPAVLPDQPYALGFFGSTVVVICSACSTVVVISYVLVVSSLINLAVMLSTFPWESLVLYALLWWSSALPWESSVLSALLQLLFGFLLRRPHPGIQCHPGYQLLKLHPGSLFHLFPDPPPSPRPGPPPAPLPSQT